MNCRRRKGSVTPNAHMKPAASREGNGVKKHDDKHGLERDTMPKKDAGGRKLSWGK
jgi:hypothetical protein